MSDEATTRPTLDTILERINALAEEVRGELTAFREEVRGELTAFREEVRGELTAFREEVEIRLDRIESMTNQTRAEMLTLRADFREFRSHLKEPA